MWDQREKDSDYISGNRPWERIYRGEWHVTLCNMCRKRFVHVTCFKCYKFLQSVTYYVECIWIDQFKIHLLTVIGKRKYNRVWIFDWESCERSTSRDWDRSQKELVAKREQAAMVPSSSVDNDRGVQPDEVHRSRKGVGRDGGRERT